VDNLWCTGEKFPSIDEGLRVLLDRTSSAGEQALASLESQTPTLGWSARP